MAPTVAQAAMDSGVARKKVDINEYKDHIERILGPTRRIVRKLRKGIVAGTGRHKKKPNILIPHGHDSRVIKAAQIAYDGDVDITLLGSHKHIVSTKALASIISKVEIVNPFKDERMTDFGNF